MNRIRLFLFSTTLLVALLTITTSTTSGTAFAKSTQQNHVKSHTTALHTTSGGPGFARTTQPNTSHVKCSGNGCNGQNPVTTGCDASAKTIQTAVFNNSYVELRYSPACGTNWGRVTSKVGLTYLTIRTQRIDGLTYAYSGGKYAYSFSAMVYAPVLQARACGGVNGISGCTAYV